MYVCRKYNKFITYSTASYNKRWVAQFWTTKPMRQPENELDNNQHVLLYRCIIIRNLLNDHLKTFKTIAQMIAWATLLERLLGQQNNMHQTNFQTIDQKIIHLINVSVAINDDILLLIVTDCLNRYAINLSALPGASNMLAVL